MAWIPEEKGSWALPLRHERITSFETPITQAAFQLRLVCRHLKERPISLWDSEYGCAKFVQLTADINADKLMRLRPNRCLAKITLDKSKIREDRKGAAME